MVQKVNSFPYRIWHDPVLSTVIASAFIALIGFIFRETVLHYLFCYICIKRWVLLLFVGLSILFLLIILFKWSTLKLRDQTEISNERNLDVKLIERILGDLPNETTDFFRYFDFHSRSFKLDVMHAFGSLSEKMNSDPAFEFFDHDLEKTRRDFDVAISNLVVNVSLKTYTHRTFPDNQTAYPDSWEDMDNNKRREYEKEVFDKLNELKDSLYIQYCKLIKDSKKKLRIDLLKK